MIVDQERKMSPCRATLAVSRLANVDTSDRIEGCKQSARRYGAVEAVGLMRGSCRSIGIGTKLMEIL